MCVREHSCACVYTQGLGTLTASQHNIFDSEKLTNFSCAPDGIQTVVLANNTVSYILHDIKQHGHLAYT